MHRLFSRSLCLDAELGLRRNLTKKLASQKRPLAEDPPPPRLDGPIARVATARLKDDGGGSARALTAEYEHAQSLYRTCDGCLGAMLMLNRERNRATSITMWRSPEHLSAAVQHPDYAAQMQRLGASFASAPEVETMALAAAAFMADGL